MKSNFFSGDLNEFQSALQLSVDSEITSILQNPKVYSLSFLKKPQKDERWDYFEQLTAGEWKEINKVFLYQFSQGEFRLEELTQFLFLTRLKKENILKLANLDPIYRKYASKIFGTVVNIGIIENLEQVTQFVFAEMEKRKITIRELAHQSGLSMVSISNFKAGKDIRLSNFLKILSVLGIKMKLE